MNTVGMEQVPEEYCGTAMMSLGTDKMRRFAFIMGCGELSAAQAARQAGYSDHLDAARVQASRMMQNPDVLAAIQEVAAKSLSGLVPLAIRTFREILEDPKHPARSRVAETLLDRTGFSSKTEHKVTVEHRADMAQLEEFARRLALEQGLREDALLPAPKVIEGVVTEVKDGSS